MVAELKQSAGFKQFFSSTIARVVGAVFIAFSALFLAVLIVSKGDLSWLIVLATRGEHSSFASLLNPYVGGFSLKSLMPELQLVIIFGMPFAIPAFSVAWGSADSSRWKPFWQIIVPAVCLVICFWYAYFGPSSGAVGAFFAIQFFFSRFFWSLYLIWAVSRWAFRRFRS